MVRMAAFRGGHRLEEPNFGLLELGRNRPSTMTFFVIAPLPKTVNFTRILTQLGTDTRSEEISIKIATKQVKTLAATSGQNNF